MTLSASAAWRGQTPPRISDSLDSPELAAAYDRFGMLQFDHGQQLVALFISRGEKASSISARAQDAWQPMLRRL